MTFSFPVWSKASWNNDSLTEPPSSLDTSHDMSHDHDTSRDTSLTSIDTCLVSLAPSSPGYVRALEDPVETAIREWESRDDGDVTCEDELTCSDIDDVTCSDDVTTVKQEDDLLAETLKRSIRGMSRQTKLDLKVVKSRAGSKSRAQPKSRARPPTTVKSESRDHAGDPHADPHKSRELQLTLPAPSRDLTLSPRITCIGSFLQRLTQTERDLASLAQAYLDSKRADKQWHLPPQIDHVIFDWAFVSRKSGLPKQAVLDALSAASPSIQLTKPLRWSRDDDTTVLYLKEVEQVTWKEAALLIRYRHSWQAVQMRYLRTLCRLTGKWSQDDSARLEEVMSRDWRHRWKRLATEMGPQFPVERVYRHVMGQEAEEEEENVMDMYSQGRWRRN
ncbi:Myb-related protein A [Yarrowia sp. B02]|nr:Myb-related protein A [Yarrowia sp. B02]